MIIVYLSVILVVCAIVLFIFSLIRTAKQLNGTLADLAKTTEKMRKRAEEIAVEKKKLDETISSIQLDFVRDKEKFQRTSRRVQQLTNLTKDDIYKVKVAIKGKA
ncbi:MAG: hypothetical protein ABF651_06860 [Sporolactobacillus sp.]